MITDLKKIEDSALEMSVKDRAALAKKLIESLDSLVEDDVDQAWSDEVKRRKAELKSGEVKAVTGPEVHKAARDFLHL